MILKFTETWLLVSYIMLPIMLVVSLIMSDLSWLVYSLANCGLVLCIHGIHTNSIKEGRSVDEEI